MKALSIKEPWASAITDGKKSIECRNWKTSFRGEFLIHASKQYDRGAPNFLKALYPEESCKLGHMIGRAVLLDIIAYTSDRAFEKDSHLHLCQWTPDELDGAIVESSDYGFVIIDTKRIAPIPCKGSLNFFQVPETILTTI